MKSDFRRRYLPASVLRSKGCQMHLSNASLTTGPRKSAGDLLRLLFRLHLSSENFTLFLRKCSTLVPLFNTRSRQNTHERMTTGRGLMPNEASPKGSLRRFSRENGARDTSNCRRGRQRQPASKTAWTCLRTSDRPATLKKDQNSSASS